MRRFAMICLAAVVLTATAPAAIAGAPDWAWNVGKQNNNGAIQVKSLKNPGTTYNATQNPTGTNAKVNQNAATQPPLVYIQAGFNRWSMQYADRAQGLP